VRCTALVDVGDGARVKEHASEVAWHFGTVHPVNNNAGIGLTASVLDSSWADYKRVLRVNLNGVIHGMLAFLPHLIASGDGHVVNISSLNGYLAQPGQSHYSAAKFGVRGFTETLRTEMLLARTPVRVTAESASADDARLGQYL
jgi:NADP-dependent 3-hydroxy acid dehydrogenase YdfG